MIYGEIYGEIYVYELVSFKVVVFFFFLIVNGSILSLSALKLTIVIPT